ncbi:uncharacterized protein [Rutidosis leptorrhynchoides]|uniref:uncharacterized protein n=1 Tax=Rutidosis leptorrhynchoides TaxID=125765 RepID=UPI003A996473
MVNPRRNSQSLENPFQSSNNNLSWPWLILMLKKPQSLPFLLSVFVLLTWVSLRLQYQPSSHQEWSQLDDSNTNLVRFKPGFPSTIAKDKRGWLLNPVSLALDSAIKGGAVSCVSVHVGEIRPGSMRGNHRHHTCNETFVIWGAKTLFRLENREITDKGYAETIIGADEVAVVASPSGIGHAIVNIDNLHTTYFIGCQDSEAKYNGTATDFNIWKDL